MKTKKSFSARLIAVLLAFMMVFSAVPLVFAAPTGPVAKSAGDHKNGVDTQSFVSMKADYQNFTFIQTEDNQNFQFSFVFGAKKNKGANYGWIYHQKEKNQTLRDPIGKSFTVNWSSYQQGLPGNLFGGNNWKDVTITVNFVAEGAKMYSTALRVHFDGRPTDGGSKYDLTHDIPLTITVIDKRALNTAIANAKTKLPEANNFTEATWSDLTTYLAQAQKYEGNVIANQDVINRATDNLNTAVEGLLYKNADYTALEKAKSDAKIIIEKVNAEEVYTPDSLKNLAQKYDEALAIPTGLDIRRQAEVTRAADELQAAVKGLVKFANYKALEAAVNNFNKLNPKYFAPEEFAKVKVLADKAKEDLKPENKLSEAQQNKVNAQALELNRAIAGLKKLPADYKAFDEAVAQAKARLEGTDINNYTDLSVKALEDAYIASADVLRGKDVTYQPTVDAATKILTEALRGLELKKADYAKLDVAIAKAKAELQRSDLEDFDAASIEALRTALKAAENIDRKLTVDKQNVIDAARDNLAAKTHLVLKGADYSGLNKAIAARKAELANARNSGKYTEGSMTRLQIAINVASSVDRTYTIKEQNLVDDAIATLNSVTLEKKAANTKNLEKAINDAQKTLNEAGDEYTDESKAALQAAIKHAREVLAANGSDIDKQAVIDAEVIKLQSVKLELKKADYKALDEAIAQAEKFLADPKTPELYTPEAIEKVKKALENAKNIDRNLTIKEQAAVDAAVSVLESAKPDDNSYNSAELSALNDAIAYADKLLAKEDIADYTEESVNALKAAYDEAKALAAANPNVTQQNVVNEKAQSLSAMTLTLKNANYEALEVAVAQATLKLEEARLSGKYTEESLKALEDAIISANALLENQTLTIKEQKVVDAAVEALNVEMGYKGANLTALNAEIAKAQDTINSPLYANYTLESRTAFERLLAQAKALAQSNPDITQQDAVNSMAQKLANAELVLRNADYKKLDDAIAQAEKLLQTNPEDKFTKQSIEALKSSLRDAKNVDRNLDITQQNAVDVAIAELTKAMQSLVPYSKVTDVQITHNGSVVEGDVAYEKVTWYRRYKKHSTKLGYKADGEVVDVKWELANWSVDKPEATIVDNGDGTVTVTPNGRGIGARSVWVKVTVTDINGNTSVDYVKVRFYKWKWQMK